MKKLLPRQKELQQEREQVFQLVSNYFEKLPNDEIQKDSSFLIGILKPKINLLI